MIGHMYETNSKNPSSNKLRLTSRVGVGTKKPTIPSLRDLIELKADRLVDIPTNLPAFTPRTSEINDLENRWSSSQVYEELNSNIDSRIMSYTQEPFPENPPTLADPTPFRKASVIREWVDGLFDRNGYRDHVEFNTTVELAEKVGKEWVLTLRKSIPGGEKNYWWQETFDAIVVASGHYSVPNFPFIPGILEFEANFPGSIQHSKLFRGPKAYEGKVCGDLYILHILNSGHIFQVANSDLAESCRRRCLYICYRYHLSDRWSSSNSSVCINPCTTPNLWYRAIRAPSNKFETDDITFFDFSNK